MSLLLDNNVWERLLQPNVLTGIILLVVGVIAAIFAKKITKLIRKSEKVEPNDRVLLTIKAFALVVILAALIVMIIQYLPKSISNKRIRLFFFNIFCILTLLV